MKKFLSLFCFFTFAFLFLSSPVKAEITSPSPINPTYNDPTGGFMPSPTQYQGALSESGANLEKFTLGQLDSTIQGLTKIISGYPSLPGEQVNGGAISGLGNLVAGLYTNQPISSREYLAYVGQNIGFTTPTYAASQTGFNALSPVLPLWTIMRNLAYLAFVFIFVVIGLMVMLRKKIDPRTVASIQEALPRIVVALILVTFSYALVGLIVDLTQLTTAIIGNILVGFRDPTAQSVGDFLARFQEIGANKLNIFTAITPLINVDLGKEFIDPIQKSLGGNGGVIGFISTGPLKDITGGLVGLVVAIAILTTLFKIFFNLLTAYVSIILAAIFSPFQFLLTALPGNSGAIGNWFRNIIANALVFPATFLMLFLAAILSGPSAVGNPWAIAGGPGNFQWNPPPLGVFGETSPNFMWKLIAIGILLVTPKVGDMVKEAFQVKGSPWGAHAGQALQGAAGHIPLVGGFLR